MANFVLAALIFLNPAHSKVLFQRPEGEIFLRENHPTYVKKIESSKIALDEIFDVMQTLMGFHHWGRFSKADLSRSKTALITAAHQIATLLDRSNNEEYKKDFTNFNMGIQLKPTLQMNLDSAVFFVMIFLFAKNLTKLEIKKMVQTFDLIYEDLKLEIESLDNACVKNLKKKTSPQENGMAFALFNLNKYLHELPFVKKQMGSLGRSTTEQ